MISFVYDAYGRDTVRIAGTDTAHFVFGEFATPDANNISSYVVGWNRESRDSLAFDVRGRLAMASTMRRGIPYGIRHVFNADGSLAQRYVTSTLWPTAKADSFSYNIARALVKYVAFGLKDTIALDGDNLATSITAPNGLVNSLAITSGHDSYQTAYSGPNGTDVNNRLGVSLFYDQDGRIVDHRRVATSDSLRKHTYGSDGWLDSRRVYGTTVQSGCVYDPRGGVVCNQDQILTTETYSYDGAGNLLNGVTRVDAGNRVRAANGTTYDYDADGNLSHVSASGVTKSLTWSPLGTLTGVTITGTGAATVSYGYDAFGRRVRKTINTDTTGYLWDGSLLSMELSASGQPIAEYSNWGGVDSPRAVKRGGVVYYFAMDPVSGSVHGLIRASDDSVVAQYGYTPYGTLEAGSFDSAASGPNPIRYQGREYDNETGLYYFRARYYDPTLGRFISEDPLGLAGGSANLYEFAGNDPVNGDDPSGAMFGGTIGINFFNNCTKGSILGQKETICIHWGRKGALQKSPSYDYAQYRYSAMLAAAIKNAPAGTGPQPAWMHEPGLESGGWADPLFLLGGWEGAAADELVERGLMKLAPEARVFYSGAGAKAAAEVWAKATGSVTIEMTEAGQQLERLTAGMDRVAARDLWKPLSADFASGADGVVHVFHGLSVSMESVWATVEYPILAANPNVSIMYHVVW